MNIDNLVTMANQIGTFFESYPDPQEGRTEIANHLQRFWAPRMRSRLFSHLDETEGEGLKPMVIEALLEHRRDHMPPPPPGGDAG
ncbi:MULTISPECIES: formate dehydrogenase subunit delta [Massilia]|jgi:formate dehydrogenase subunit delta|uniref:Formate dehydrogenase subunit delta n=1 Tax=Massilia arenae TaxID=2603288 RepID=A0A5C7FY69_9BURK|nr:MULTISPECIES: formate dehydrogenase subunit delta [Massilia]MDY0965036.1 formate dehydrogenase subunit delta [Massilia sp. CFBP9026]MDY0976410.1 formate dehydrogenase subunit delta [Massilia sp. CFBP9012]TXG01272.1 formate dehydrogenase subunit delta [Massilia arenae]